MPGGNPEAWPHIKDILQGISAKVGEEPCCDWVGDSGAGHYVKMVHNGIEYGDMQLCCEAYDLMKNSLGMSCDDMSGVFREWNKGVLDSFLIEITADILGANSNAPCLHLYICGATGHSLGYRVAVWQVRVRVSTGRVGLQPVAFADRWCIYSVPCSYSFQG